MEKPKKMKHNYTSELELKSLLIRIKNMKADIGIKQYNKRINKYIEWHTKINNKKYDDTAKKNKVKKHLKSEIVRLSELTCVDKGSYERFGKIILLMIKKILTKPSFSGYTYKDEFYSDAVHKILKYLHNFNHKLISATTNQPVNAFSYISQIIHNSILFIINTKKKELENHSKLVDKQALEYEVNISKHESYDEFGYVEKQNINTENVIIDEINGSLVEEINNLKHLLPYVDQLNVYIPEEHIITFEEYNELKELLKGKVSIMRNK